MTDYYWLGLGNAGDQYQASRHNLGWRATTHLKTHWDNLWGEVKWQQHNDWPFIQARYTLPDTTVNLILPLTYMNRIGPELKNWWPSIDLSKLIVLYDDLDLPLARLKIDFNRGTGGHRGLASIIQAAESRAFIRFRLGIAPVSAQARGRDFVLSAFTADEEAELKTLWPTLTTAADTLLADGLSRAQTLFN